MKECLEGLITASFTPMNADRSINLDMIEKYAQILQRKSIELVQLFKDTPCSFLSATEFVIKMVSMDCRRIRPPERNVTDEQYGQLKDKLEKIGFFDYCCK